MLLGDQRGKAIVPHQRLQRAEVVFPKSSGTYMVVSSLCAL